MTTTKTPRTYKEVAAHRERMLVTFDDALVTMLNAAFENPAHAECVRSGCTSDAGGLGRTTRIEWGERLIPHTDDDGQPIPWTDRQVNEHSHELVRLCLFDWFRPTIHRSESGVAFGQMRRIELRLRDFIDGRR